MMILSKGIQIYFWISNLEAITDTQMMLMRMDKKLGKKLITKVYQLKKCLLELFGRHYFNRKTGSSQHNTVSYCPNINYLLHFDIFLLLARLDVLEAVKKIRLVQIKQLEFEKTLLALHYNRLVKPSELQKEIKVNSPHVVFVFMHKIFFLPEYSLQLKLI